MKTIKLHFVCRGNVHRSRLAEAYFKSLNLSGFQVSSSGVEAEQYAVHAKLVFAALSINKHPQLKPGMSTERVQTTKELLDSQDVIVCVDKSVFDDATRWFELDSRKTLVWNIKDIVTHGQPHIDLKSLPAIKKLEESIFTTIRRECDLLAPYLTKTSWADITDEHNRPTGLRLPVAWANDRALWHRGCHVVIVDGNGKFLVEKRSKQIVFAPGLLDISLGGSVDADESPLQAAVRETREELGLHIPVSHFKPLFIHRWSSYHPHYKKYTRAYIYTYFVQLPTTVKDFTLQTTEVEKVTVLDPRQVHLLLRKYYLRRVGGLVSGHKYYAKAVRYSLRQASFANRSSKTLSTSVK